MGKGRRSVRVCGRRISWVLKLKVEREGGREGLERLDSRVGT